MMKKWEFETESYRESDPKVDINYQPQPREPEMPDVHLLLTDDTGAKSVWIHAHVMDHLAAAWLAMRRAERKTDEASPNHVPF